MKLIISFQGSDGCLSGKPLLVFLKELAILFLSHCLFGFVFALNVTFVTCYNFKMRGCFYLVMIYLVSLCSKWSMMQAQHLGKGLGIDTQWMFAKEKEKELNKASIMPLLDSCITLYEAFNLACKTCMKYLYGRVTYKTNLAGGMAY